MDITERKRMILAAVVKLHITSGDPVGSSFLNDFLRELSVSSATLRNEMAELTALGFLEQPHTSAGRVPTKDGVRYYLDNLVSLMPVPPKERELYARTVGALDSDPDKASEDTAKILSEFLKLPVVTSGPVGQNSGIVHFKLLVVGRYNLAVIAVNRIGSVKSRVCRLNTEPKELEEIENLLNRELVFISPEDLGDTVIDGLAEKAEAIEKGFSSVIGAAASLVRHSGEVKIYYDGLHHLLRYRELDHVTKKTLELFSDSEFIKQKLAENEGSIGMYVGDELGIMGLDSLSLIVGNYRAEAGLIGAIGIAGPLRMNYAYIIPRLSYYCELLSDMFSATR